MAKKNSNEYFELNAFNLSQVIFYQKSKKLELLSEKSAKIRSTRFDASYITLCLSKSFVDLNNSNDQIGNPNEIKVTENSPTKFTSKETAVSFLLILRYYDFWSSYKDEFSKELDPIWMEANGILPIPSLEHEAIDRWINSYGIDPDIKAANDRENIILKLTSDSVIINARDRLFKSGIEYIDDLHYISQNKSHDPEMDNQAILNLSVKRKATTDGKVSAFDILVGICSNLDGFDVELIKKIWEEIIYPDIIGALRDQIIEELNSAFDYYKQNGDYETSSKIGAELQNILNNYKIDNKKAIRD